jgi:hypothetical protein
MTEIESAIAENRQAVDEFVTAARNVPPARWQTPRAEGAWSPAQIVEHLAITFEFNRQIVAGTAPPLPALLRPILRPLLRRIVITNTLKAGRFTRKGRTPAFLKPSAHPPGLEQAIARLDAAVTGLEGDLRSRHPEGRHTIAHPAFGQIATHDWMRVQAIHARHHRDQLTSM